MRAFIILPLLALSACAPSMISDNAAGGIVKVAGVVDRQRKGMEIADQQCGKYGKIARYRSTNEIRNTLSYDCVAK